jgi:hypothetical protein
MSAAAKKKPKKQKETQRANCENQFHTVFCRLTRATLNAEINQKLHDVFMGMGPLSVATLRDERQKSTQSMVPVPTQLNKIKHVF